MRLKKPVKVILWLIILTIIGLVGYKIYSNNKSWKIEIVNDYINMRAEHEANSTLLAKVKKGKQFKVLDSYTDDPYYIWYKIKYKRSVGWVASDRYEPYVKEINNPNAKTDEAIFVDYNPPVVRFYENEYVVDDINSINYDHLDISDESSYTISHVVYYEEHPIDTDVPQYWILYIVTDEAGNTTKKFQKIVFVNEPAPDKVKNFEEFKNSRS